MTLGLYLLCMATIVLLAIYWTLWKIREELGPRQDKLMSELAEIRKSLETRVEKT
ncbi:MAG: hypothetical protein ACYSW0_21230 [Planctomycetota bacterium]|jgi:hypothetical protein